MGFAALITWFVAILAGLYMLAVWLIENDITSRGIPSRLPTPIIFGHLLLAAAGFTLWVGYLVMHRKALAWAAVAVLLGIATLGLTMFLRWIPVYYGSPGSPRLPASSLAVDAPAEGHFPVILVYCHGVLAVTTLVLVLLTTLGLGG
jgi:manganese efflux pump family protein